MLKICLIGFRTLGTIWVFELNGTWAWFRFGLGSLGTKAFGPDLDNKLDKLTSRHRTLW